MIGRHVLRPRTFLNSICVLIIALVALSACGSSTTSGNGSTSNQPKTPIKIGISVSLSGDFSADGKAIQEGYELWAQTVNNSGGLLGRQVSLDFASDASSTTQVQTNYQKFITTDHDDLVLGPYSTLLTKPASVVANRYGYAFIEGAGGGPSVFTQGLNNLFAVSPPVVSQLSGFTSYILSLPASQRPTSAAYATEDDPFTQPMIDTAKAALEQGGIKTAYYKVYPAETTDFTPIAQGVVASHAQLVVLGSMLPDIIAYVKAFQQQHFNPEAIAASAGPDQGSSFSGPIGGTNVAEGLMYPNGWYAGLNTFQNKQMVQDFIAKFGGTADQISADSAEAFSVGQVLEQAVNKIHSIDNTKLIAELHSDTFQTVQGPAKFNAQGENTSAETAIFQWQKGSVVPVLPQDQATSTPEFPKPNWP